MSSKQPQDPLLLELGHRISQARQKRNLSQEDLALLTGLHRTYISSLERGHRNVGFRNLALIAASLNVTLSDLLAQLPHE